MHNDIVTAERRPHEASDAQPVDRVDRLASDIREREVERALRRLEATGELTDAQRAAVHTLADRVVTGLLVAPLERIETDAPRDECGPGSDRTDAALRLFERGDANADRS